MAADFLHLPLSLMDYLLFLPVVVPLQEVSPHRLSVLRVQMVVDFTLGLSLALELVVNAS